MSDDLLRRATRPTLRRIRELCERVPEAIRPLLEKIAERFNDPTFSGFQILRAAGASDWHGKLFKKELGIAPWQLVLELRAEVTLWLLRETPLSVEDIALIVGYGSESSLRKLLRRTCGFSPAEGRSHLRQVVREYRDQGDELMSWYFWVRYHRGEVEVDEFRGALTYLERRFGPA
jgi:AraC-like DNA-binding protein